MKTTSEDTFSIRIGRQAPHDFRPIAPEREVGVPDGRGPAGTLSGPNPARGADLIPDGGAMFLRRYGLRHAAGFGLSAALLLGFLGFQAATAPAAHAATGQFHGVNWADPNDNFITGPNVPV